MAGERHTDSDGSDIFWPGYVDAVTNLVLNLLFLLTVMTVAVFMFALELGRASRFSAATPPASAATDTQRENAALKREVQRLQALLGESKAAAAGEPARIVDVTTLEAKPMHGLDRATAGDTGIVVRFAEESVTLSPEERERLIESLRGIVAGGRASLTVEVPPGFSEAKRLGFYRVLEVRNVLLEMKLPNEKIEVAVREAAQGGNAALVRVRSN